MLRINKISAAMFFSVYVNVLADNICHLYQPSEITA